MDPDKLWDFRNWLQLSARLPFRWEIVNLICRWSGSKTKQRWCPEPQTKSTRFLACAKNLTRNYNMGTERFSIGSQMVFPSSAHAHAQTCMCTHTDTHTHTHVFSDVQETHLLLTLNGLRCENCPHKRQIRVPVSSSDAAPWGPSLKNQFHSRCTFGGESEVSFPQKQRHFDVYPSLIYGFRYGAHWRRGRRSPTKIPSGGKGLRLQMPSQENWGPPKP